MKILQIIQRPQLRGAEVFACQLATELIKRNADVDILYLFEQQNVLPFSLKFISLQADAKKRFWDFRSYKRLRDVITQGEYDVVQANAGDTLKYAALSKMVYGWKTPLIFRNANKISDFMTSKVKRRLNSFFINQLHHVISVSELCKHDFIKTFSFPDDRIDAVQIGINLQVIGDLPADLAPLFSSGPVLINVASLVKEKNQHGLLRIFKRVLVSVPDARLVIVGMGKLENELKLYAKQLGIDERVHFLGYRNDVLAIMKASKAFLLSSLIEGLPGVILEAQYCNIPVIAYDVGGISEVVHHEETGWLIEKDNEEKFLSSVQEVLLGDSQKVKKIVSKAGVEVLMYDNTIITERFYAVYKKVIQRATANAID